MIFNVLDGKLKLKSCQKGKDTFFIKRTKMERQTKGNRGSITFKDEEKIMNCHPFVLILKSWMEEYYYF